MNTQNFTWEYQRLYERTKRILLDAGIPENEAHELAIVRCVHRAFTLNNFRSIMENNAWKVNNREPSGPEVRNEPKLVTYRAT